ncbi:MAG: cytidine deaminase [Hyphomonadaceae bacterium]|nr:cytidine deaminase [Clostridia bacterium]
MDEQQLMKKAMQAMRLSYAPYSKFTVGVALLSSQGEVFLGANIENASFGATICAERVALSCALMAGARQFEAIAIVANSDEIVLPCGICRQVLVEHCTPTLKVICSNQLEAFKSYPLSDLMPIAFTNYSV